MRSSAVPFGGTEFVGSQRRKKQLRAEEDENNLEVKIDVEQEDPAAGLSNSEDLDDLLADIQDIALEKKKPKRAKADFELETIPFKKSIKKPQ